MTDIKKNIEKLLFESGESMYSIYQATGIAQTTLSRFVRKESDVENMSLKNAIKLNEYYLNIKEEEKMKLEKLKEVVKDNVEIMEDGETIYALHVEDNGDEHTLAQAENVDDLLEQLRNFGQIK